MLKSARVRWAVIIRNSLWIRPVEYILSIQSHLIFSVKIRWLMHRHSPMPLRYIPGCRGGDDLPKQIFARDLPLYEVEAMSLIHGQIARMAWPSIMAASRGKVLTLDASRPGHFAWGPLMISAGTPEGVGFVLRRMFRLKSARSFFPNITIEGGRVGLTSEWGAANLEECLWDPSDPEAEQDCMLMREYLNPTPKRPTTRPHQNLAAFIAWAQADPEVLRETVRGSLQYFSYFFKLASCSVPQQNLAIKTRLSFTDALVRRVLSAGALTRLTGSKSHAELAELAKHLAQADRSETDYAVFQSCLERLTKDNVIYDAAAEEF